MTVDKNNAPTVTSGEGVRFNCKETTRGLCHDCGFWQGATRRRCVGGTHGR